MTDLELVLEATERILKGYPEDLSEEERWERFSADAALCAAYIQELQARSPQSEERPKPLDKDTAAHLYGQGLI